MVDLTQITVDADGKISTPGDIQTMNALTALVGALADAAWVSGNGTLIAILKAIATADSRITTSTGRKTAGSALATTAFQIGGVFNSTPPTVADTQEVALQVDANGYLKINIATGDGLNDNGRADAVDCSPMVLSNEDLAAVRGHDNADYETVAASQTDQALGATGATGDYLAGVLIVPGTAAAGAVSIKDGSGSSISIFAGGGTTALPTLAPFFVPIGALSTGGAWKITTGANVTAIGVGSFT